MEINRWLVECMNEGEGWNNSFAFGLIMNVNDKKYCFQIFLFCEKWGFVSWWGNKRKDLRLIYTICQFMLIFVVCENC